MTEETEAKKADYSPAFQTKMIRVLFQDPDMATTVGVHLKPEYFDGKVRRWLAGAVLGYATRHGAAPTIDAMKIQLRRDLKAGILKEEDRDAAEASVLNLEKEVADRSFVKEEALRFAKNQVTKVGILNSVNFLQAGDFEAVDRELSKILEVSAAGLGGLGHFYVRDLEKRLEGRKEGAAVEGFATGTKFDSFSKAGGIWPEALGVVVGRYGIGKSSCLVSFSRAAILESKAKVAYISLELPERQVGDKFDAGFADVGLNDLLEEEGEIQRTVTDIGTRFGEVLVVKSFPSNYLTTPMLRAYLRQLERKNFYPNLLVVDTVETMLPMNASRDQNTYHDQGNLYLEVRGLIGELKLACWTGAQLNRDGAERETATGTKISDSIKKLHVADISLIINQKPAEAKVKMARFWVDKNRDGPKDFEIKVRWDMARSMVYDA